MLEEKLLVWLGLPVWLKEDDPDGEADRVPDQLPDFVADKVVLLLSEKL